VLPCPPVEGPSCNAHVLFCHELSLWQGLTTSFSDRREADTIAQQIRIRRESAFKRIGVRYQAVE